MYGLVSRRTVNFRACYHPQKPICDTTLFREYLEGIIDSEPGFVFGLTGDLNGLRTVALHTHIEPDQLVHKPTQCNNIVDVFRRNRPDMSNVEVCQSLLKT